MPFPVNSLYEIRSSGKEPVIVKIIESPAAIYKIKVEETVTKEMHYLVEYLVGDAEIREVRGMPQS